MDPVDEEPPIEDEGMFGQLPDFADEANIALDAEVKQKEKEVSLLESEIEEVKERLGVMREHLSNARGEFLRTQQLYDAKNREIESENHLKQLAEREAGRLRKEIKKQEEEKETCDRALNDIQNRIFRRNEQLNEFKSHMEWNQEELEQWALAAKQKEEDNLALQRYQRQDEAKIKDLTMQIEKLTKEHLQKHAALEEAVTETQACQIELDKAAEDFRKLHKERQDLMTQWEQTIAAMQRRDKSVAEAQEKIALQKTVLAEKKTAIAEKERFLAHIVRTNQERENEIDFAGRAVAKYHTQLQVVEQKRAMFADEVEVLRATVRKAANDVIGRKAEVKELREAIERNIKRIEAAKQQHAEALEKLEHYSGKTSDLDGRAREVEKDLAESQQLLSTAEKDVVRLKNDLFKQKEELFAKQQEQHHVQAQINGVKAALRNLKSKIARLDQESLKQQELVYNQEFQIQQLERKVARIRGERSDEEKRQLNERIAELTTEMDAQNNQVKRVQDQMRQIDVELKMGKRKVQEALGEREQLAGKITELTLDNESLQREFKVSVKTKEDLMVNSNVTKLEVARRREMLNRKADEVFGLENRRQQLELSMEERVHEIKVHEDMLRAQLKVAEENRHRIQVELGQKKLELDKLSAKYDIVMGKLGTNATSSGNPDDPDIPQAEHSQAYYIIKAAQEREELQRNGDRLDEEVRKVEKEVRALEKTLAMFDQTNSQFRKSFHRTTETSGEAKRKAELQQKVAAQQERARQKRREVAELQQDAQVVVNNLREIQAQFQEEETMLAALEERQEELKASMDQQSDKYRRAAQDVARNQRKHRRLWNVPQNAPTPQELEMRLHDLRKFNEKMLADVLTLGADHDVPAIRETCERSGLVTAGADAGVGLTEPPS